jgi:hypothetical protein
MRDLSRRLFMLEAKAGQPGKSFCLFLIPGEDVAAALTSTFGMAGAPPGAKITLFSCMLEQDCTGAGTWAA